MSQNIKERPILMNGPMVRAVLNGSKTQTRRLVKEWSPRPGGGKMPADVEYLPDFTCYRSSCPHGKPGDRLWVREAWSPHPQDANVTFYRATVEAEPGFPVWSGPWIPSIHMPRRASRITLEITSVRVERLQDISIEDAKAEGAWGPDESIVTRVAEHFGIDEFGANPRKAFQMLWESINGPGSWDQNPWVWVIEFKRIEGSPA